MNLKDFVKPTILTAQQYGTKVTVEIDHSDTSLDELFDAFQTLIVGLGYHMDTWNNQIKSMAEELIEEENENLKKKLNHWKYEDRDELENDFFGEWSEGPEVEEPKPHWDWDEESASKRMDVIGQNGNEGLHYDSDGFEDYQFDGEDYDGQFDEWDNETPNEDEEIKWPKPNNILIDAKKQYDEQVKKEKTKKNTKKTKKTSPKTKAK